MTSRNSTGAANRRSAGDSPTASGAFLGEDVNDVHNSAEIDDGRAAWRINSAHVLSWRSWDGEIVVYDDLSGDTMKLEVLMAEAFRYLHRGPATLAELTAYLAKSFDLEDDFRLTNWAARMIERFEKSGLIEPAADPAPGDHAG